MRKILKKLFSEDLVLLKHFNFAAPLFAPFFNIFSHFINAFLWKDVFIIGFFSFGGFSLVNEFIDQFDFSVNEILKNIKDQDITPGEDHQEGGDAVFPVFYEPDATTYGKGKYEGCQG
jgi:hypothetical protein